MKNKKNNKMKMLIYDFDGIKQAVFIDDGIKKSDIDKIYEECANVSHRMLIPVRAEDLRSKFVQKLNGIAFSYPIMEEEISSATPYAEVPIYSIDEIEKGIEEGTVSLTDGIDYKKIIENSNAKKILKNKIKSSSISKDDVEKIKVCISLIENAKVQEKELGSDKTKKQPSKVPEKNSVPSSKKKKKGKGSKSNKKTQNSGNISREDLINKYSRMSDEELLNISIDEIKLYGIEGIKIVTDIIKQRIELNKEITKLENARNNLAGTLQMQDVVRATKLVLGSKKDMKMAEEDLGILNELNLQQRKINDDGR